MDVVDAPVILVIAMSIPIGSAFPESVSIEVSTGFVTFVHTIHTQKDHPVIIKGCGVIGCCVPGARILIIFWILSWYSLSYTAAILSSFCVL